MSKNERIAELQEQLRNHARRILILEQQAMKLSAAAPQEKKPPFPSLSLECSECD